MDTNEHCDSLKPHMTNEEIAEMVAARMEGKFLVELWGSPHQLATPTVMATQYVEPGAVCVEFNVEWAGAIDRVTCNGRIVWTSSEQRDGPLHVTAGTKCYLNYSFPESVDGIRHP